MAVKSLIVSPSFDEDTLALIHDAEAALERILGDAASRIEVAWTPAQPEGGSERPVQVTLRHAGASASDEFDIWELHEPLVVRRRLRQVWDRVLVQRYKFLRERLLQSLETGEEG